MTLQEIFDKVALHLLRQGERAYREPESGSHGGGMCLYYDPITERRCAAGCLIPAGKYNSIIEGCAVPNSVRGYDTTDAYVVLKEIFEGVGIDTDAKLQMVGKLQETHDHEAPSDWKDRPRAVAAYWGLVPSVLGPKSFPN